MSSLHTNTRPLRFIIIGAGISGLVAAIRLRQSGYDDYLVLEKADRVGGTWRENTYPGVACDIPAHWYSFSFALNPEWSRQYATGDEIQRYLEGVTDEFGVQDRIRFGQEVTRCEFVDGRWHVFTKQGMHEIADVLIGATGVTHHPHVPDLPGLQRFAGAAFHSARWDHDVKIDGARVGVIGTGSSSVQIVSALVPRVAKLSLFQRTAQWIMPQEVVAYTDEDRAQFRADPSIMRKMRASIERRFVENFSDAVVDADSQRLHAIENICREYLESEVRDSVLQERLRPNYRAACKRLVVSSEFYPAIQRSNAELVTNAIECIEPEGVRTCDGRLHALDVLVLATGFRTNAFIRPAEIIGPNARTLDQAWTPRPIGYLCVAVPGFPNFFLLNGPNGPVGNFPLSEVAELQMNYVLQLVDLLRTQQGKLIAPSPESTAAFENARIEATKKTVWTTGCRSWYLDGDGVPASWPWTIQRFRDEMARPKLADYVLSR